MEIAIELGKAFFEELPALVELVQKLRAGQIDEAEAKRQSGEAYGRMMARLVDPAAESAALNSAVDAELAKR
jgi:hypothetical protein